jgi:molecular chaperone GrpE
MNKDSNRPPNWKAGKLDIGNIPAERKLEKEIAVKKNIFRELLDIVDDIDRIFENEQNVSVDERKYLQIIRNKLSKLLNNNSVVEMIFDDNKARFGWCEICGTEKKEGVEDETILKVIKKGYIWEDKVLRPASVIIAKNKE